MERDRVLTVSQATLAGSAFSAQSDPSVTMFGLRRVPSMRRFWSSMAFMTVENTLSETAAQVSMEWDPSVRISGSMIGTSLLVAKLEESSEAKGDIDP